MALVDSVFAEKLKTIFRTMSESAKDDPKDNDWYAEQLAKAIDDQIKTAQVQAGIIVNIPSTSPPGTPSAGVTTSTGVIS